jgi:hypothetical protein
MAEQLASLLKTDLPSGSIGYKATIGAQEPFISRKEELQKGITQSEGEIAKATQAQAETRETGKLKAQEGFGTAQKGAMQQYQQKLQDEPIPAFVPTKDTAQDLAGLFSLVSVIGMVAGKQNGLMAMNAMNGMLEGYQKGRGDLYKKESVEFEKNFKSMLKKHEEFRKEMEDAIKLASTDKEAGMQAAELAAVKAGSDIVRAQLRKGDLVGAYKLVDETQKGVGEAVKAESQIREKAADRANAVKVASARSGVSGVLPKDTKTNDEHRFRYTAIENVKDVLADLQNPEIRKLIGPQNQYLPDVILNLQDKYPQLAQKLARFQSQEFQIGGKNLTKTEQGILGPIYNWRGLTAKALEDNLTEADRALTREQMILEARYPGLQEIGERYSSAGTPPSAPAASGGQNIQQDAIKRFGKYEPEKYDYGYEDGKFYRDEK